MACHGRAGLHWACCRELTSLTLSHFVFASFGDVLPITGYTLKLGTEMKWETEMERAANCAKVLVKCRQNVANKLFTSVDAKHHGASLSELWNVTWVGNNSVCKLQLSKSKRRHSLGFG